jgi:hypothetical protein
VAPSQRRNCSFPSLKRPSQASQACLCSASVNHSRYLVRLQTGGLLGCSIDEAPAIPAIPPSHPPCATLATLTQKPSGISCLNKRLPRAAARARGPLASPANRKTPAKDGSEYVPPCRSRTLDCHLPPRGVPPFGCSALRPWKRFLRLPYPVPSKCLRGQGTATWQTWPRRGVFLRFAVLGFDASPRAACGRTRSTPSRQPLRDSLTSCSCAFLLLHNLPPPSWSAPGLLVRTRCRRLLRPASHG